MAGDHVHISDGPIDIELLPEVGARFHRLRAFGHDLLRTPDDPRAYAREPFLWGAYVMAPWCNRIEAVPTRVGDRTVDLRPGFPDRTAIHGQVASAAWTRRDEGTFAIRAGGDGWPWPYEVEERVSVAGSGLRVALRLTNLADEPMPAGIGLHPWFVGPLDIAVAASRVAPNLDPAGGSGEVAGRCDLRRMVPVPDDIDATWLDVAERAVDLRWPALGLEATMRLDSNGRRAVAVASPAGAGVVAVEPQTPGPWGLRRYLAGDPDGLQALLPGASLDLAIELEVRRST